MYTLYFIFFFNDTATTEIYTVLTHSFPTRRSSDLRWGTTISTGLGEICAEKPDGFPEKEGREAEENERSERSEEHTSELQSLMRISYAVFCLKKKKNKQKRKIIR